jgi:ribokinase
VSVLVVGNAALDRVFAVQRLPTPGETLLARSSERRLGGKGVNQAVAAARAGADVRFVGGVGSDPESDEIARYLAAESVETVLVRGAGATDESVVMVASDGENAIVSTAHQARSLPPRTVDEALEAAAPGGILLVQGNLSPATTRHALKLGGECRMLRIANAAPVAFAWDELQPEIDVLIVNAVEAGLVGPLTSATVIVTEGASGASLIQGSQHWQVPAPRVAAIDTTGAGDVLCGVLAAVLDRRLPMPRALECAVRAAALKVTRAGTSSGLPTAAELRAILD